MVKETTSANQSSTTDLAKIANQALSTGNAEFENQMVPYEQQ
jgi:hypothetical protein